jgi:hypothetical protein
MQWARFYLMHKKKNNFYNSNVHFLPYVDNAEQMIH